MHYEIIFTFYEKSLGVAGIFCFVSSVATKRRFNTKHQTPNTMKIIDYIEDDCPTWALSYLVNGDASGLDDGEAEQVDEWLNGLTEKLKKQYPDCQIEFLREDGEGDCFTPYPAFGLACSTVKCAVAVFADNEHPRESLALPWEDETEETEDEETEDEEETED